MRTVLQDLIIIEPRRYFDDRGSFEATFRDDVFENAGTRFSIAEQSLLRSRAKVIRGFAYQLEPAQSRLVKVMSGAIFDVAVDIRRHSPTFGKWSAIELSSDNGFQLFVPAGFAHGYLVLADDTQVLMSVDKPFMPATNFGLLWNDPDLAVDWPISEPIMSARDAANPRLCEIDISHLPAYAPLDPAPRKAPSCFISYAHQDEKLVQRLYTDLKAHGVAVWFAPEDMQIGAPIRDSLEEAIGKYDRVIVLLSRHAIASPWVEAEVEAAFEKERETQENLIVPLALDREAFTSRRGWVARIRRTRHIGDFSHWRSLNQYSRALDELLMALGIKEGSR